MRTAWVLAAWITVLGAACEEAQTIDCGTGGELVHGNDGRIYCVYAGSPGRTCPQDYPFALDVESSRVCAEVRTTVEQLPAEVCAVLGVAMCGAPDPERDAGPDDLGARDVGVPDLGPRDARVDAPDGGPPSCEPVLWESAYTVLSGMELASDVTLATTEMGDVGHVHVGLHAGGRFLIANRSLAAPETERGLEDVSNRLQLVNERSMVMRRDLDSGDVWLLLLHDGITDDDTVRATVARLALGATAVDMPTRIIGPNTHQTLGRGAITGGANDLPRRYVWRNRSEGRVVLASETEDVASDYIEVDGVTADEMAEVRGSIGRAVLVPVSSEVLGVWDNTRSPIVEVPTPGRATRAAFVYEGADSYVLAYQDGMSAHLRRVVCTAECLPAASERLIPLRAQLEHTMLEQTPGGFVLGFGAPPTEVGAGVSFELLTPAFDRVPRTQQTLPIPDGDARHVYDAASATVRHRGETHVVVAVLTGDTSMTTATDAYITGMRFPAGCD